MIRRLLPLALALALPWTFSRCSSDDGATGTDSRVVLLESWGEGVILPWYRSFESGAAALQTAATTFCADPAAGDLEAVKAAWIAARTPWKQAEVLAFGPYADEPLRVQPKVDFWPVRTDSVDEVLAGTMAVDAAGVAQMGASTRGLPVIEYLLWSPPAAGFAGRPCEYLQGLTADLVAEAEIMRSAWDPAAGDYLGAMLRSGSDGGAFDSLQMAAGEIPNRMAHTIGNIRRDKLSGGESPTAKRAREDILANLAGIEQLFEGTETHVGIAGLLDPTTRGGLIADIRAAFDASEAALLAIDGPLGPEANADQVAAADAALGELQTLIQADLLGVLGFTATFNDADGD